MPTINISPQEGVVATLTIDGVGDTGTVNETRNVTGYSVTNNLPYPIWLRVQETLNAQRSFERTIQPGETVADSSIPQLARPQVVWHVAPNGFWDGLDRTWRIPA